MCFASLISAVGLGVISLVVSSASAAAVGGGVLADASGGSVLSVAIVTAISAVVVALIGAAVTIFGTRRSGAGNEALGRAMDYAIDRADRAENKNEQLQAALDRAETAEDALRDHMEQHPDA